MSDVGYTVIAGCLFAIVYGAIILGLRSFSSWAVNREAERTAAATFDRDFIPTVDDVAATERDIAENEMCAVLDEARDHVEGLLFAAEIAELEDVG